MNVLTDFTVTKTAFTWDPNDPNWSTNGQFDPAKLKPGTGSCRLNVSLTQAQTDIKQLAHSALPQAVTDQVYIVGIGVLPP